ncbi:major facilitator superfamily domain-containing protein [Phthorimaea operculella]|nr:major facilitator superfamily domain-containing protein [Phthorimaea operculella]
MSHGLTVRTHALAGSAHANYALVAAAELPALLANTLLLDRVGRRPLLTAAFLLTAVTLIAIPCLPDCKFKSTTAAELPALLANTLLLDRVGRRPLLTAAFLLTAVTLIAIPCLPETASSSIGTALYLTGKVGATMSLNALYVYSAELFPTRARHRLLAACSTLGRLGAILAPLTPLLAQFRWWVPTVLFGTLPLISAALTRLVPDTLHQRLPDSFADLEPPSETTSVA